MFLQISIGIVMGILISSTYSYYITRNCKKQSNMIVENKKRMFQMVERSKDIIYYLELKPVQKFTYISSSIEHILGHGIVEKGYENPNICMEYIHPDDKEILIKKVSGELDYDKPILQRLRNQQGDYLWLEEYATPIYEKGELVAIQGIIRNIDEEIKLQHDLEFRVNHDCVTQIYNRMFFENQIEKYDKHLDVPVALILFDLDELKVVNDKYGHRQGDMLIAEAAKLLNGYSTENIIVARIGGDEFAILLTNVKKSDVETLCDNISKDIRSYNENSANIKIKMSKGYACSHTSNGKMEILFTEADQGMYKEKRSKKRVCFI